MTNGLYDSYYLNLEGVKMNNLHLPILAISLAVILIALTLPKVELKVTEPEENCFKVITSKTNSFETPSIQLMDRMEKKGYKITECDR